MNEKKLISIVVPAYNCEYTLRDTLNSLLNQTFKDFEVIIINDGSTDGTNLVANEFTISDKRFRYFFQKNSGVSATRNRGVELSNGIYICFLDSDDYFENTYLYKMYEKIIEKDMDVCYCGYNVINSKNNKIKKRTKFNSKNILLDKILGKINIHTTGWLIKKSLIIDNGITYRLNVSWGEDFEFFNEILANTDKVCYVDEYLTNYRINHNDGQLSNFSLDKIDKDFESIMRVVENTKINRNNEIEYALVKFRLKTLIVYRLISAIDRNIEINYIKMYYKKYEKYIKGISLNNGLRSLKLNIKTFKLRCYLKFNK